MGMDTGKAFVAREAPGHDGPRRSSCRRRRATRAAIARETRDGRAGASASPALRRRRGERRRESLSRILPQPPRARGPRTILECKRTFVVETVRSRRSSLVTPVPPLSRSSAPRSAERVRRFAGRARGSRTFIRMAAAALASATVGGRRARPCVVPAPARPRPCTETRLMNVPFPTSASATSSFSRSKSWLLVVPAAALDHLAHGVGVLLRRQRALRGGVVRRAPDEPAHVVEPLGAALLAAHGARTCSRRAAAGCLSSPREGRRGVAVAAGRRARRAGDAPASAAGENARERERRGERRLGGARRRGRAARQAESGEARQRAAGIAPHPRATRARASAHVGSKPEPSLAERAHHPARLNGGTVGEGASSSRSSPKPSRLTRRKVRVNRGADLPAIDFRVVVEETRLGPLRPPHCRPTAPRRGPVPRRARHGRRRRRVRVRLRGGRGRRERAASISSRARTAIPSSSAPFGDRPRDGAGERPDGRVRRNPGADSASRRRGRAARPRRSRVVGLDPARALAAPKPP